MVTIVEEADDALLGELGPRSRQEELAEFGELVPEERALVSRRLAALHAFAEAEGAGSAEAERLAASIGMGRSNFMRLLARVRAHGAVAGLSRHRRVRPRASAARDGLPAEAEGALAAVLREDPAAALSRIEARLRDALPAKAMPTLSLLRRRVYAARHAGAKGPAAAALVRPDAVFGSLFQVAAARSDVLMAAEEAPEAVAQVGLVVDRETRLIVGAGLALERDDALAGAAADVVHFGETMVIGGFAAAETIPTKIEDARLYMPDDDGSVGGGDAELGGWRGSDPREGRDARTLLRLVGDRVVDVSLRPQEGRSRASALVLSAEAARARLARSVDRWNYLLLCSAAGVRPDVGPETAARRRREWSRGELVGLEPILIPGTLNGYAGAAFAAHGA